jgi:hypothetical protein
MKIITRSLLGKALRAIASCDHKNAAMQYGMALASVAIEMRDSARLIASNCK